MKSLVAGLVAVIALNGSACFAAGADDTEWPAFNNGYDGQRYSPLTGIDARNVQNLAPVCSLKIADAGAFQAGPLVIGGTIIVTSARSTVALDAATCAERWRHDYLPTAVEAAVVNRGAASLDGRLFRGTGDGRLLALDGRTGNPLWTVIVGDPAKGEALTSAPIAWKSLVFIGISGGDFGVKGRMMAFDAATGREVWRFDTIPTGRQAGTETWQASDTALTGGGAMWSSYTLDVATGELFIPVGNPAPDLDPAARPGKNLYTDCVVVLDAETGALKWWYQLKSPDGADHDLGAAPVLYRNSQKQSVVAMAGKDGYVTAVDRDSHRPLFRTAVTTIKNVDTAPTPEGVMVCPGMGGGTKWNGPAYDPIRKTLFVAATDWCSLLKQSKSGYVAGKPYWGGSFEFDKTPGAGNGWVTALDADTGTIRWRYQTGSPMGAAVTPTAAGLMFTGDAKGNLLALDSATGKLLLKMPTGGALAGGMVTYRIGGRQYLAFTSGNISRSTNEIAGPPTLMVMAVADASHPVRRQADQAAVPPDAIAMRPGDAARGKALYQQSCAACHGGDGAALPAHSLKGIGSRLGAGGVADRIENPKAPMPKLFPLPFGRQDVVDIAAYAEGL